MTRARFAGAVSLLVAATLARARAAARRLAVLALVALAALSLPAPARASEVTAAELRRLATAAAGDPAKLAELRRVDVVDGRPADIAAALGPARGPELEARLAQLAQTADVTGGGRDARADARAVLAEDRFREDSGPGPIRRVLEWIGDRFPSFDVDWLDDLLPGGRSVVWIVLGSLLIVVSAVIARTFLTRRVKAAATARRLEAAARDEDPRSLDRRADEAEAAGDLEAALRLRFRAGLLRLDARGTIVFRPSISTHEVRRKVASEDFDALAAAFDDIVYGGREAVPADVADARERWPRV